jgi:hypothetical protein
MMGSSLTGIPTNIPFLKYFVASLNAQKTIWAKGERNLLDFPGRASGSNRYILLLFKIALRWGEIVGIPRTQQPHPRYLPHQV